VADVKKQFPAIRYYVVGGVPPPSYLALVKKYGLESNVKFFQNISDEELIDLYYQADLFLLPSVNFRDNDFEGFGLVYLEAGACGLPVIGTYDCGAEDAIKDGVTGLLVKQNDVPGTAAAISMILNNPELAVELGRNGRENARQNDWRQVIKKYLSLYQGLEKK
jgi:phosphatidylinositol alpha-1,6-mannosyltransferase